jgi:hypothetical protein
VTSGQGARKSRKYIYFDQLLFLLPIMQERDTSGNITPQPSGNESEPQGITTGKEMEEDSHVKNATRTYYRQQKRRSKTTYEESLLEIYVYVYVYVYRYSICIQKSMGCHKFLIWKYSILYKDADK